ncbi:porin, partial [Salmonella enterica subsp. enterica serovar Typhimurium]|nr:porin [Salmonella enterica subsp. enterica serovar Typhimurium]
MILVVWRFRGPVYLGGGLTNIMARLSESLADGFYANSDYIAWASPLVF